MVTKREIAAAQQALNEAVAAVVNDCQRAQNIGIGFATSAQTLRPLADAYEEWDDLRRSLDGQGPAVARSTSIAAAKERLMLKQSVRRDILTMVVAHYQRWGVGMTADQILARMRGKHQTISARVSELANTYGLLRDSGKKVLTSSGSKAIVWEPTPEALQIVAAATTGREPE